MPTHPEVEAEASMAIRRAARSLRSHAVGEVYALVFFATEGLEGISLVFATRDGLAKRLRRKRKVDFAGLPPWPDVVDEADAGGWSEGLGHHALLHPPLERLCDRAGTPGLSKKAIELSLIAAILKAKADRGPLSAPCFARRPLLGLQLADAEDLSIVLRISKRVNDVAWHEKMVDLCAYSNSGDEGL